MSIALEFMIMLTAAICISILFSGVFSQLSGKINTDALSEQKKTLVAAAYCNLLYFNYGNVKIGFEGTRPNSSDVSDYCFGNPTLNASSPETGFHFENITGRWFPAFHD